MKRLVAGLLILAGVSAAATLPLKPGLYAVLNTSQGNITVELYEKYVPVAVRNFVGLAQGSKPWLDPETRKMVRRPMYQDITFHRVLPEMMIQTGDPTGKGTHNCGINLQDEFLPGLLFDRSGRLAVANTGQVNSGGCQFFLTDGPVRQWDGKYTIFGQVVAGQDVVHAINRMPLHGDKPDQPAKLNSVTIERISKTDEPASKTKNIH